MALFALDIVHGRRDPHLALLLVSAAAVLLRLDMLLPVAAVQLWVWAWGGLQVGRQPAPPGGAPETAGGRSKARNPGVAAGGPSCFALAVAGYGVFRWVYFHDLLPNTYYLKMAGIPLAVRLLRGGSVLLDSLRAHGPLVLAVAVGDPAAALLLPRAAGDAAWRAGAPGRRPPRRPRRLERLASPCRRRSSRCAAPTACMSAATRGRTRCGPTASSPSPCR